MPKTNLKSGFETISSNSTDVTYILIYVQGSAGRFKEDKLYIYEPNTLFDLALYHLLKAQNKHSVTTACIYLVKSEQRALENYGFTIQLLELSSCFTQLKNAGYIIYASL